MKKRTKKKIKKMFKNIFLKLFNFTKSSIAFLFKQLWNIIKKITSLLYQKTSKSIEKSKNKQIKSSRKNNKPGSAKKQDFKDVKIEKGDIKSFNDFLLTNPSTIGLILGARGTGKSAIGMFLLEQFAVKSEKNIYAIGFKQNSLPKWIKAIKDINQIENDSVLLVDEGGITFSSRNAMSNANKFLSELLLIARHKDLSVIFITQNSSNLEVNVIRQADYLILKPSSLLQKDFERKRIKKIYESVESDFEELKNKKGLTYIYSDKCKGFVTNTLPSFWSDKVSKSFRK